MSILVSDILKFTLPLNVEYPYLVFLCSASPDQLTLSPDIQVCVRLQRYVLPLANDDTQGVMHGVMYEVMHGVMHGVRRTRGPIDRSTFSLHSSCACIDARIA